ncbi:polysaccharide pyruvyl transferase family protein [Sanguibacter sp. 25GB23B1]|uniref:polysaccharide pyruvyl transferase family protein n=1 Tax=unclassified Sanguibacter TaxID=2645534 RepID=UPI0032AEE3A0
MTTVKLVHWNPRETRTTGSLGRLTATGPRKDNFGDLLGPYVVEKVVRTHDGLTPYPVPRRLPPGRRPRTGHLLTIGSVMHFARTGDTVWGTGVNGKIHPDVYRFTTLDVRAVRGLHTQRFLTERGIDVPDVYGDPALLLPHLDPRVTTWAADKRHTLAVIPNLNEVADWQDHPAFVDPRGSLDTIIERLARSERVVSSSLHGLIISEALGIPVALVRSRAEPSFKYDDYVSGTGRTDIPAFDDLGTALAAATEPAEMSWDPGPLLRAFPWDLWGARPVPAPG